MRPTHRTPLPHRRAVPRRLPRPLQVRQTGTRPATGFQKQTRTPQTVRRNDRGFSKIEGLHRNSWFCLRIHLPPKFVTRWGGKLFSEVKNASPDASWHPLPIDPAKAVAYRNTPEPVSYAAMINRTV